MRLRKAHRNKKRIIGVKTRRRRFNRALNNRVLRLGSHIAFTKIINAALRQAFIPEERAEVARKIMAWKIADEITEISRLLIAKFLKIPAAWDGNEGRRFLSKAMSARRHSEGNLDDSLRSMPRRRNRTNNRSTPHNEYPYCLRTRLSDQRS